MKRLPKIGERVRYRSSYQRPWEEAPRELLGTVRKLYPGYEGDSLRPMAIGSPGWAEHWSASVEVDAPLPAWWSYQGTNLFAPSISELESVK